MLINYLIVALRNLRTQPGFTAIKVLRLDFIKPVIVACMLGSALAYYVTDYYFAQFSAQASLPLWVFVLVVLSIIVLSLLTVATQCIRIARADPVRSLRSE